MKFVRCWVSFPGRRIVMLWAGLAGHQPLWQKEWPFSSFIALSAYSYDPTAGQIPVTQHIDAATIMKHRNVCLGSVGMPPLFQKLMTDWLIAARSTLRDRKSFKCKVWGWLSEKSLLSSNSWECLWQAFQEDDQYNSYHVSHIDDWLSIVICVSNGKPMLLVLKRETERGRQTDGE